MQAKKMQVKNIIEDIVWQNIDVVLDRTPDACRCQKCRADIAAYALNKLKPHYVVSQKGETIARAASLDHALQINLLVVLTEAVELVCSNPRHLDATTKPE